MSRTASKRRSRRSILSRRPNVKPPAAKRP
jgi:hypothetical protein